MRLLRYWNKLKWISDGLGFLEVWPVGGCVGDLSIENTQQKSHEDSCKGLRIQTFSEENSSNRNV